MSTVNGTEALQSQNVQNPFYLSEMWIVGLTFIAELLAVWFILFMIWKTVIERLELYKGIRNFGIDRHPTMIIPTMRDDVISPRIHTTMGFLRNSLYIGSGAIHVINVVNMVAYTVSIVLDVLSRTRIHLLIISIALFITAMFHVILYLYSFRLEKIIEESYKSSALKDKYRIFITAMIHPDFYTDIMDDIIEMGYESYRQKERTG